MTVSAIIPTWNRNDLLFDRSLVSVLRQTHPVDEVLIVADGMEGGQLAALKAGIRGLRPSSPMPIRLRNIERQVYPEDPGQRWCVLGLNARNWGLDHARGDWIAPLDDDDEWTDDHVEVLLDAAVERGVDFVYGKSVVPISGQTYGFWPPSGMNFTDGSQMYRRDLGYRYDPACIERWLPEDADLWNRMIAGGVTFTFVPQIVHRYYPNPR